MWIWRNGLIASAIIKLTLGRFTSWFMMQIMSPLRCANSAKVPGKWRWGRMGQTIKPWSRTPL